MDRKLLYIVIFTIAVILRLIINFSYDLIPGVNGGYYPVQVRSVLTDGSLSFSDMPLYFYLNAFIVKAISCFGKIDTNSLIILVLKIIDSVSLPLLLIPLYKLSEKILNQRKPLYQEMIIIVFSVCSISPLIFTSDLQKNGFAIPFLFAFILFAIRFLYNRRKKELLFLFTIFILIGLSHFGVFIEAALLFILGSLLYKKKKTLILTLIIAITTLATVAIFNPSRASRLIGIFSEIFLSPTIIQRIFEPLIFLNLLTSYALIGIGIFCLKKLKNEISSNDQIILKVLIINIFILSFPFLNIEYAQRLTLMLFIPQAIMALFLLRTAAKPVKIALIALIALTIFPLNIGVIESKKPAITQESYNDLFNLKEKIVDADNTLIIARHGLEWWVAWALQVKVVQDKAFDQTVFEKYSAVILLNQKKGINQLHGKDNIFYEPFIPGMERVIYDSNYFAAYELTKR